MSRKCKKYMDSLEEKHPELFSKDCRCTCHNRDGEEIYEDFDEDSYEDEEVSSSSNPINHPTHYNHGKYEVIDVIDDWGLGFSLGNCIKYIARARHKGKRLEDLKKAMWYLEHEIEQIENLSKESKDVKYHF